MHHVIVLHLIDSSSFCFFQNNLLSVLSSAFCILCFKTPILPNLGNQSPEFEEEENHWMQTCWRYFEYELHTYNYKFIKNQACYFDRIGMKANKEY